MSRTVLRQDKNSCDASVLQPLAHGRFLCSIARRACCHEELVASNRGIAKTRRARNRKNREKSEQRKFCLDLGKMASLRVAKSRTPHPNCSRKKRDARARSRERRLREPPLRGAQALFFFSAMFFLRHRGRRGAQRRRVAERGAERDRAGGRSGPIGWLKGVAPPEKCRGSVADREAPNATEHVNYVRF